MNGFTKEELLQLAWAKPILAQLEITNQCNQDCAFCYQKRTLDKPDLSLTEWQVIISKLLNLGIRRLDFTGSENFMSPYLKDLLVWCKQKKLEIRVNTNGTYDVSDCLPYIDELVFSAHGLENIHDMVVKRPGSFKSLEKNVLRSSQAGVKTSINMTLVKSNYHQLVEVYDYFTALFPIHKFAPVIPISAPQGNEFIDQFLEITPELIDDYKCRLSLIPSTQLLLKQGFHSIFIDDLTHYQNSKFPLPNCAGGKYKLIIDSDGRVFPCNFFKSDEFYCGNMLTDDEQSVWKNGKGFVRFRNIVLEEKISKKCGACAKKLKCFSGCRAWSSNYQTGGFEYVNDQRCEMGCAFIGSRNNN